ISIIVHLYFFFSSRRRHTRFSRDWSSDVCSSDLDDRFFQFGNAVHGGVFRRLTALDRLDRGLLDVVGRIEIRFARSEADDVTARSEEHTSELQSRENLVCRLLLEKKKNA